jgi:hypothetical protein
MPLSLEPIRAAGWSQRDEGVRIEGSKPKTVRLRPDRSEVKAIVLEIKAKLEEHGRFGTDHRDCEVFDAIIVEVARSDEGMPGVTGRPRF